MSEAGGAGDGYLMTDWVDLGTRAVTATMELSRWHGVCPVGARLLLCGGAEMVGTGK